MITCDICNIKNYTFLQQIYNVEEYTFEKCSNCNHVKKINNKTNDISFTSNPFNSIYKKLLKYEILYQYCHLKKDLNIYIISNKNNLATLLSENNLAHHGAIPPSPDIIILNEILTNIESPSIFLKYCKEISSENTVILSFNAYQQQFKYTNEFSINSMNILCNNSGMHIDSCIQIDNWIFYKIICCKKEKNTRNLVENLYNEMVNATF